MLKSLFAALARLRSQGIRNDVLPGDIIITGTMTEDETTVESPPGTHVVALYGCTLLTNGQVSAEAMHAAIIVVPPSNLPLWLYSYPDDSPRPWIHRGIHVLAREITDDALLLVQSPEDRELRCDLDGREKTVTMEGQQFDLTNGKYFVVTYDSEWGPTLFQIKDDLQEAPLPPETLQLLRERLL